ncbi:MAG: DUF882 domain-containing protein [Sinobacteraceae bacterium]|nr:DUF882 domain-containing protein [Nevskiaceae bacterium]
MSGVGQRARKSTREPSSWMTVLVRARHLAVIWLLCTPAMGAHVTGGSAMRQLELHSLNTREMAIVTLTEAGPTSDSVARLRHLLRDYRINEEHDIDNGLLLQLSDLARAAGCAPVYEVISGYRAPRTNAALRAAGHAVAEHSLHMEGRAIDVRLRGYPLASLRDLALAAKRGGVGYYPRSNFVHLDTGRVRTWQE